MRIIYTDGRNLCDVDSVRRDPDKVFAVIGPFESHLDAPGLQEAILRALQEFAANTEKK
jgi:hypothetical protein